MEHGGDESLASMVDVHGCCAHQRLAQPQLGEFQARGRWGRDSFTALRDTHKDAAPASRLLA